MNKDLLDNDTFVFICCNQKEIGKCCAENQAEDFLNYIREKIKLNKGRFQQNKRVKAVKTSCLGKCVFGPNILICPDNVWYTFTSLQDADEIIESHLIKGKIVERLVNHDISITT